MATAALLLAALVLTAPRARLEAAVEVGVHVGSETPDAPSLGAPRRLELSPGLTARVDESDLALEARYAPRLFLRDGGGASPLGLRQTQLLSATFRASPTLQWAASERVRYGRNELGWDPGATRPLDLLETIAPLIPDELVADGALGFSLLASRTLSLNASAGYAAYGGTSAASQRLLPLQHGPQLYAGLDQELTRLDRLSTDLYGALTVASNGRRNAQVKLTESWQRLFSATTRGRLSAGASGYRRDGAPDAGSLGIFPVASAALEHELLERGQRVELRATACVGPHQSRLTTELLERAELSFAARWIVRDPVSIRGRAGAARELGASGAQLFLGGLDLAWQLGPRISLAAGTQTLWQQVPAQGPAFAFRWIAFTALRFGAQDLL
ncbi:MAG: hypothetical protein NVS4B10_10140 [Myxococcales bacterium]